MCDNIRKQMNHGPLSMNLGGQLIWISMIECLDYIGCVHNVFGQFPTFGIGGIVKPFPLNKVKELSGFVQSNTRLLTDLNPLPKLR